MTTADRHGPEPVWLEADGVTPVPWRNGRGLTRELAVRHTPEGDLLWRISIGELTGPAPFSTYPGTERLLTALGEMTLTVDGTPVHLEAGDQTRFAGEATVSVDLTTPTRALNVMTRRGWGRPEVLLTSASVRDDPHSHEVDAVVVVDGLRAEVRFGADPARSRLSVVERSP